VNGPAVPDFPFRPIEPDGRVVLFELADWMHFFNIECRRTPADFEDFDEQEIWDLGKVGYIG
jgi:hypothetical protein